MYNKFSLIKAAGPKSGMEKFKPLRVIIKEADTAAVAIVELTVAIVELI